MTVGFLGVLLYINGRYRYTGLVVSNAASVTFLFLIRYYGRQWSFIWCYDTLKRRTHYASQCSFDNLDPQL